ncbi:hypothetical protein [Shewanella glacialimarina]|uniref:hypothetical protein n=1 Tax=Shewanella glacialimarina TaxID=2590884 RepID=UPI001CF8DA34|nr:hypothetical protein [Shewanella glacialimarina]UCX05448.1 hypothetical protein FJ709_13715 [Shewanella glacialimarina]
MTSHITTLLDDNQVRLDRVAFKLRLAELLDTDVDDLRNTLSTTAVDTPHLTLQLCAAILHQLRGFKSVNMCDKRKVVFHACKRALDVIETLNN